MSPPVHLRFSYAPVSGGLYYWSAHPPNAPTGSPDEGTTYRLAFGARRAAPFITPGHENPNKCEGCHAVSRDGSMIAFTATDSLDVSASGDLSTMQAGSFIPRMTTAPSVALSPPPVAYDSAMIALNNDGSKAIVGSLDQLSLRAGDQIEVGSTKPSTFLTIVLPVVGGLTAIVGIIILVTRH